VGAVNPLLMEPEGGVSSEPSADGTRGRWEQ
jgi:hypothetical protein